MDRLFVLAAMAEIFGGLAIIIAGVFGAVQLAEFRKRRKYQVAAELCRKFSEPEFGRAVTLVRRLPDGVSARELEARGLEYEQSALIVAQGFETMGLLVYQNLASFTIIQQLTGGLLLNMMRKLSVWFDDVRTESGNRRFAEWMQWLAERIAEEESDIVPAYQAFTDWRRGGR